MHKYRKHQDSFESRIVSGIFSGLTNLVMLPFRKKGPTIDLEQFRTAWQRVEQLLEGSDDEVRQALVQADTLVDSVLREKVAGQTMGDRLKNARGRFSERAYDYLWEAHKLRNTLVHEAHAQINTAHIRMAVGRLRKPLEEIGVL